MLRSNSELEPRVFFATHPFFRYGEFAAAYMRAGHSLKAAKDVLAYYVRKRVLFSIRRGVYYVADAPCVPWLLPSKISKHAVVAYDGAASLHGLSGVGHQLCYFAPRAQPRLSLNEIIFRGIAAPWVTDALTRSRSVVTVERDGHRIDVTPIEQTIVDCFERLDLGPDVEQIYDTLLSKPDLPIDLDAMVRYALTNAGAVAAARLGLLLSSHPRHRYAHEHIDALERRIPRRTTFATRDREFGGMYFRRWHLVVPNGLSKRLPNQ